MVLAIHSPVPALGLVRQSSSRGLWVTACKPLAPLDRLWCIAGLLWWSWFGLAEARVV